MSGPRDRQLLREAEGYLELGLASPHGELAFPLRARISQRSAALEGLTPKMAARVHALMLRGHALKLADRHAEAIAVLDRAAAIDPENLHIYLSLAWCHKRTGRIDLAIQALEEALLFDATEPIVFYNLACYWALGRNVKLAVSYLTRALDIDESLRERVADEPDFDTIRHEHVFLAALSVIV